jgi:hypothetical protein
MSGCLLFTDPINRAPEVDIVIPQDPVERGRTAYFYVNGSDDRDNFTSIYVEWGEFAARNEGCGWITKADWGQAQKSKPLRDSSAAYEFKSDSVGMLCLCVMATDRDGAKALDCERIDPVNVVPVPQIIDASGALSGQTRPLCSSIHLSAEESIFSTETGDAVEFHWGLEYSGSDAVGISAQIVECDGVADAKKSLHRCFHAGAPGTYVVRLSITDTPPGAGTKTLTSEQAVFKIPVAEDTPPCLQRTEPDVHAQHILLSRSPDLGVTYDSRTFKVLSAADDCEPYPVPATSGKQSTQFVWSIYDATKTPPWQYSAYTTDSFKVSQESYPNAQPGDTIKVRVEVRDAAAQKSVMSGASACASPDTTDICCDQKDCTGDDEKDCIRWTTWTVHFQP